MHRREFFGAMAGVWLVSNAKAGEVRQAMTVLDAVPAGQLGVTLPHEHIMVDFVGADQASPARYDADKVFEAALPHLLRIRELGCRTLVECTPAYLGRDPVLLKRLSERSGLRLLTNTGYYGAARDKFLPPHAFTETADQLAARWVKEWRDGIDGSGVRPGFLKLGVDSGGLSEVDRKIVRAGARAHLQSGLTMAVHTGDSTAALDQLRVLEEEGVDSSAWIWVHAKQEEGSGALFDVARRGGWVEFDSVGPGKIDSNVSLVLAMRERRLLGRVLLSQDAGWYHVGEPGGGDFRSFAAFFVDFLPALRKAGLTEAEVRQLTVDNPCEAFSIRVRRT